MKMNVRADSMQQQIYHTVSSDFESYTELPSLYARLYNIHIKSSLRYRLFQR